MYIRLLLRPVKSSQQEAIQGIRAADHEEGLADGLSALMRASKPLESSTTGAAWLMACRAAPIGLSCLKSWAISQQFA